MNIYMPTNFVSGKDAVINSSKYFLLGKKALIVTGKNSAKASGALDDVLKILNDNNIEYFIFDEINQNPSLESCLLAGKLGDKEKCDYVIGIGGGSPLDAAKAISIILTNPYLDEESFYAKKWANKAASLVLIGTSAGTGSEVTKVSVLTDSKGRKHSIHDDQLFAKHALSDPRYTMSLNKEFTISTGIDALSHCVESYFSNKANDISRAFAIEGVVKLFPILNNLNDNLSIETREQLYNGSILGGLAINITGTTFAHNVGYYFTEEFNVPHGYACALFLNDLIHFEEKENKEYLDLFFKRINISKEEFLGLSEKLLPCFDIKITKETLKNILPRWENNNSVKNTYGRMNVNDVEEILINKFNI